jgi:hypothetical protein
MWERPPRSGQWRVHVETVDRLDLSEDELGALLDALEDDPDLEAGAVYRDARRGSVATVLFISADSEAAAQQAAGQAFYSALASAGVHVTSADLPLRFAERRPSDY